MEGVDEARTRMMLEELAENPVVQDRFPLVGSACRVIGQAVYDFVREVKEGLITATDRGIQERFFRSLLEDVPLMRRSTRGVLDDVFAERDFYEGEDEDYDE